MPPRFAYWTILIDGGPTAFRAQTREELAPTLHQLKRRNPTAVMKWFARGRLWESREDEQASWRAGRAAKLTPRPQRQGGAACERRGKDWRPGGQHKDPRARWAAGKRPRNRPPRRDQPKRREPEPPIGPRPNARPEPPPPTEQIVIKPEPPIRGSDSE
jgi:hypothetical protein